jgi:hypothetical protein
MKTTKKIHWIIALCVMMFVQVSAQTPVFNWAEHMGGDAEDKGVSQVIDPLGNILVTGYFTGTADFDPGPGIVNLTSNGMWDIFIQKLDPSGQLIWAVSMGGTGGDNGNSITVDGNGNIYVTGSFREIMDVDPGSGTYYLQAGPATTFILKLDPDANLVWAKQMGAPDSPGYAIGCGITLDNNGNVITAGYFGYARVDFDPGPGVFYLVPSGDDVFVQKLDPNGNFMWAKQIHGHGFEEAYSVATDAAGNVYTTGCFTSTADFNPDARATFNMTSLGSHDIFIQKLTPGGNFVWAKQIGGTEMDFSYSVAITTDGNIYVTGSFRGTVDFDPGPGTFTLTSNGSDDSFILKLDADGNFIWAKQLGGANKDIGYSVTTDGSGTVYSTGYFSTTVDFDPGPGSYLLTADGIYSDIYVQKLDPNGNFTWAAGMGSAAADCGRAIAVNSAGHVYSTGNFGGTVDFNPGTGVFNLTSSGDQDIFIQDLGPGMVFECNPPDGLTATNVTGSSASVSWNGIEGAEGYNLRYRPTGAPDWTVLPLLETNYELVDLAELTTYEFQVQTICGEGEVSRFSYSCTFTTLGTACTDIYESSNKVPIPTNTEIQALISPLGDVDIYVFSTNNSMKSYNVKVTLTNLPANYDLILSDSKSGKQLGESKNPGTADETIIYNTTRSGAYTVWVRSATGVEFDPIHCYTLMAATSSTAYKSMETEDIPVPETEDILIYPNPANTILNIDFLSGTTSKTIVKLISMSGHVIMMKEFEASEGMNHLTLSLTEIPAGLYYCELGNDSQRYFRKVVIMK